MDPQEEAWSLGYEKLKVFFEREGHSDVTAKFKEGNFGLGYWVTNNRYNKVKLSVDKLNKLNALNFVWDPLGDQWEKGYQKLLEYFADKGNLKIKATLIYRGFKLGDFVRRARSTHEKLRPDQFKKLKELGFKFISPHEEKWHSAYKCFKVYVELNNSAKVPQTFVTNDGFKLGSWVARQRSNKEALATDRIVKLDKLGFVWDLSKTNSRSIV